MNCTCRNNTLICESCRNEAKVRVTAKRNLRKQGKGYLIESINVLRDALNVIDGTLDGKRDVLSYCQEHVASLSAEKAMEHGDALRSMENDVEQLQARRDAMHAAIITLQGA